MLGPPKSDAGERPLAIPAVLLAELRAHIEQHAAPGPAGRLFPGERGGPLRKQVWQKHWTRARAKVEHLPAGFRFHDCRHTANTLAASNGASTRELMHRMGHASPAVALRYQHATRERDRAIAEALSGAAPEGRRAAITPPKSDAGVRTIALPTFLVPELEQHLA